MPIVNYGMHVLAALDRWALWATFERVQPQLLHDDRPALLNFLKRVEDGTIDSELHRSHFGVGR